MNSYNSSYNKGSYSNSYNSAPELVAYSTDSERAIFYRKTYTHVALALLAFILVETALLRWVPEELILAMFGGKFIWLFIIGGFWLGSMLANKWAHSLSRTTQYVGLGLYVLLEAVIFLPLIYIALAYTGTEVLSQAAIVTLSLFGGLTAVVFMTRLDFSFLRSVLVIGGFLSLGLIVAGALFGFELGLWFSVGMVVIAAGSILYQTYNVKNEYATDQYVGAALQLFSSVMLLFWYILRILLSRRD
ncbi:Bax inhibitor-1/YccA family protein [Capnocytophaga granulosa]